MTWRALIGSMLAVALVATVCGFALGRLTACTSYVAAPRMEGRTYVGPVLYCEVAIPWRWE